MLKIHNTTQEYLCFGWYQLIFESIMNYKGIKVISMRRGNFGGRPSLKPETRYQIRGSVIFDGKGASSLIIGLSNLYRL